MAARRLLVVMLVLLGISTLAAALVPPQRLRQGTGSSTTETTTATDTLPEGKLFTAKIDVGGNKRPVVPVRLGDELTLYVRPAPGRSNLNDDVEIPKLGLVEPMDRFAPATFDVLPFEPGSYAIRLVEGDREVGRIEVKAPKKAKQAKAKRAGAKQSKAQAPATPPTHEA